MSAGGNDPPHVGLKDNHGTLQVAKIIVNRTPRTDDGALTDAPRFVWIGNALGRWGYPLLIGSMAWLMRWVGHQLDIVHPLVFCTGVSAPL